MHKIVQLIQGTEAWHTHRAKHFNASEASAMLGCSPYQNRSDLLKAKATGITPDVDRAKQRLFDAGHAAEAVARPEAERIIEQDLYPITATREVDGLHLSASYDGATMAEDITWECKLANVALLESLSRGVIPEQYHPQLEQQLLVIGAEKALFMAVSVDKTAMEYVWYTSNPNLRQRLIAGWTQFAIDLATYTPATVEAKPIGHTPESLPALRIEVTGMVTASNLAQYKEHALAVFSGINKDLKTDQDFADADKIVKWCGDVEDRLEAAKQHALSQTESIDALFRTIDDISAEARRTRLELNKLVTARKEQVRVEIVAEGAKALATHLEGLNVRLGRNYMPAVFADFAGAIKGKRTVDSLRDAVATTLANAKIEANTVADRIQVNLNTLRELAGTHAFLFADTAQIVLKANDDLTILVKSRIAEHQATEAAKEEVTRARIQAEEQAKAEREARAKLAAEQAKAALAERDRIAEQAAFEAQERAEIARLAKLNDTMVVEAAPVVTHEVVAKIMMPPAVRQAMAPKADTPPTLSLGVISERLGVNVTSAFLATLGFEATTVKASKLFHEGDFPAICQALIAHIAEVSEQFEPVSA